MSPPSGPARGNPDRRARGGRAGSGPSRGGRPGDRRARGAHAGRAGAGHTGDDGPREPTDLPLGGWLSAGWRTVKQVKVDNLTDWAAALTYYGVLSLFPALLVLVSLIGLAGPDTTQKLIDNIEQAAPASVREVLVTGVANLQRDQRTAGVLAIVGIATAVWSASRYVGAFMRAANAIYDVPEGRPIWKTLPIRLGMTVVMMLLLATTALAVVLTGGLADRVGGWLGVGHAAVTAWDIIKWPALLIVVSIMFGLLYWAAPNAKQGFRWVTPGSLLAVLLWLAASGGFAVYVANFGSYNQTYGSLASVIIFLVWLWISNLALLLGAEMDAELERSRAITAGHPADEEPYLELRDTSRIEKTEDL
ncbi:MAG: rane protein [Mycobacteriales bacterium]